MESKCEGPEMSGREQFKPSDEQDYNHIVKPTAQEASPALIEKGGGPTSTHGKERSRCNALRHGVFAKVVVLKGEPKAQYNELLEGFRKDLRPEGIVESVLVEKLVTLIWRYRRMLIAEALGLDQILRYSANLDRDFDRTLSQLRLLQRNRKGEPEPPTLNVNISS